MLGQWMCAQACDDLIARSAWSALWAAPMMRTAARKPAKLDLAAWKTLQEPWHKVLSQLLPAARPWTEAHWTVYQLRSRPCLQCHCRSHPKRPHHPDAVSGGPSHGPARCCSGHALHGQ